MLTDNVKVFAAVTLLSSSVMAHAADAERDPTRPGNRVVTQQQAQTEQQHFLLTAIMSGGQAMRAIINDQVVASGDIVDGAEVVAISFAQVAMRQRGENGTREWTLTLNNKTNVKVDVANKF